MPENSGLMRGKRGLIMGVANHRSLAWGIAKACGGHGAELAFTYQGDALKKRVEPLAQEVGGIVVGDCDVTDAASIDAAFAILKDTKDYPAARIALLGVGKHLFRLQVKEAQAHGAVAHDALQVTRAAAAAVTFFGVERDGDVPALPNAIRVWPAPIADAFADGPYARKSVELSPRGGHAGCDCVRIVRYVNRRRDSALL